MNPKNKVIPTWDLWIRNWIQAQKAGQYEENIQLVLTLIIGAIVGLVVVAFILLTENLASRMYPAGGAAWRRLLIPILGSLLAGILLQRYFPQARGSGIPQTKAALFIHDGYISLRTTIGKFICSSISLASGIALGREGPSVHVGAGVASVLGRKLGLTPNKVKSLFPVGAAAALAAAFNTPIAAVLFSLEEVMGDMHARVLGSIVLSSATSWIVMRTILGNEPLFHVPAYQLVHPGEMMNYAILGILGGLVSVVFVKLLLYLRQYFMRFPKWCGWFLPAIGGVLVGALGWFVPEVLGVGYGHVSAALNGQLTLGIMLLLVVLKLLATTTCYATGNAGGIFGPSLFIGAMLGGSVGSIAHSLFPDYTGSIGAYALVGMGTAFAGIIRVPLTSVIMIFEITRDYSIIVPLMISNLLSYFISYQLQKEPIYEALQHQEGIHIPSFVRQREGLLTTQQAMQPPDQVFRSNVKVAYALNELRHRALLTWPIVGEGGLLGMVSLKQLEQAVQEGKDEQPLGELFPLTDPSLPLTAENFPHVHEDHPLDMVMRRMSNTGLKVLPVVSRSDLRELRGIVSLDGILTAYGLTTRQQPPVEPIPEQAPSSLPLLARISVTLIAVLTMIGFLVSYYHAERRAGAEKAFQSGNTLSDEGKYQEAIEQYRYALSISHNRVHRTALAMALLKVNRPNDAEPYLRELVQEDPDDGSANLGLARMAVQEQHFQEALHYYHRAAYAHWDRDSKENATTVCLELVEYLRKNGAKKQAVTELLALSEQSQNNLVLEKNIGQLLLNLDAAKESADLFREFLRQNPRDPEGYTGLGEAEFALGDYHAAEEAYQAASSYIPEDSKIQKRLAACQQIDALDPTLRGLTPKEKNLRSRSLLERTIRALENCFHDTNAESESDLQGLMQSARKAILAKPKRNEYENDTGKNAALVENLWKEGRARCRTSLGADDVLSRVVAKLSAD